ncbi:MAG: hypothetical protein R2824_02150 [Saprospiraceae bacterium]|nr:hypothetical protein [Lewinella sp.]
MLWRKILNRLKGNNSSIGTYIVEVSLIILSILIAIQADRFNQYRKDRAKLEDYLQSMYRDLIQDQDQNKKNLADSQKDLYSIQECLRLCRYDQNDSLDLALQHLSTVFTRGVFRAFPPTTFDIMLSTGDISLIKDISFRNRLAATFSFRDTYVQHDLQEFDDQIKALSYSLGSYINWACLATSKTPYSCLTDRKGFVEDLHNDLFIFLRITQLRAFHLQVAIQNFERTIGEMEEHVKVVE